MSNYYYSEKRESLPVLEQKGIVDARKAAELEGLQINTFLSRKAYSKNRSSQVFYFKIYTGYQSTLKLINKVLLEGKAAVVTLVDENKLLKMSSFNSMHYAILKEFFQDKLNAYIDEQRRLDSIRVFTYRAGGNPKKQMFTEQYYKQQYTEQLRTLCYYYDIPITDFTEPTDALAFAERFNTATYASDYNRERDTYVERREVFYRPRKEWDAAEIYTNRLTVLCYLLMGEQFYKPYNENLPPLPEKLEIRLNDSMCKQLGGLCIPGKIYHIEVNNLFPTDPIVDAEEYGNTDIMDDLLYTE